MIMKHILNNIFIENQFNTRYEKSELEIYEREDKEYFFTINLDANELSGFFSNKKINDIINIQNNLYKEYEAIKKNSSLIIYVKTNNLTKFYEKYKKDIYKIEEDEYFFRKFVLVYTDEGIKNLNIENNISDKLKNILLEPGRMDNFENVYFKDEEFFLTMQLYVKLSFLTYSINEQPFISINERILMNMQKENLTSDYTLIKNWLSMLVKKEQEENNHDKQDYLNELENAFKTWNHDGKILLDFFNEMENTEIDN